MAHCPLKFDYLDRIASRCGSLCTALTLCVWPKGKNMCPMSGGLDGRAADYFRKVLRSGSGMGGFSVRL